MRQPKSFLILILFVTSCLLGNSLYAEFRIKEEMPEEMFTKAGLDKLSPEELQHLNTWMAEKLGKATISGEQETRETRGETEQVEIPKGDDAFGLESVRERVAGLFEANSSDRIESTIPGNFRGWDGDTVFRLANGQVWKQTQGGSFYVNLDDPKVIIKRALFGSYLLRVEGYGSTVRVERIK